MKRIFLLCLFTILLQNVQAQYFELVGCAPDFANQQLPVLTIVNPILNTSDTIATVQLAADGTFCAQISIPEHTWIQLPNGVYNSILFAEPGKSYTVQLPPFSKKQRQISETHFLNSMTSTSLSL